MRKFICALAFVFGIMSLLAASANAQQPDQNVGLQVFDSPQAFYSQFNSNDYTLMTNSPVDERGSDIPFAERYVVEEVRPIGRPDWNGYLVYRTFNSSNIPTTRTLFVPATLVNGKPVYTIDDCLETETDYVGQNFRWKSRIGRRKQVVRFWNNWQSHETLVYVRQDLVPELNTSRRLICGYRVDTTVSEVCNGT